MDGTIAEGGKVASTPETGDDTQLEIANIFAEVLEIERVAPDGDFFDLGGDSIKALQVVARANELGLDLQAEDIFRRATPARLAAVARKVEGGGNIPLVRSGEFGLSPAQTYFFQLDMRFPDYFNQAQLFEVSQELDPYVLDAALHQVVGHHDALRLRFRKVGSHWMQSVSSSDETGLVQVIDVAGETGDDGWTAFQERAEKLHQAIDLTNGPLIQALLAMGFKSHGPLLLVVAHHLVVDGVSWRILLNDLETAYDQLIEKRRAQLPLARASFREWCEYLNSYATSADFSEDLEYWVAREWPDTPLCRGESLGGNLERSRFDFHLSMDGDATRRIVSEVPRSNDLGLPDLMLAAAGRAAARICDAGNLLVDVAHHGRLALTAQAPDVSRTVGWFSTFSPICLDVRRDEDLVESARRVRRLVDGIPNQGFTYFLMRYLVKREYLPGAFLRVPTPNVLLTYAGQFNRQFSRTPMLRWVGSGDAIFPPGTDLDEIRGALHHPDNARMHEVVLAHQVSRQQLMLRATFSRNLHDAQKAEALVREYMDGLGSLADSS